MQTRSITPRWRAALALVATLALGACDGSPTVSDAQIVGQWSAGVNQSAQSHTNLLLDLRADGTYEWNILVYENGPPGTTTLVERFTHRGEWETRGSRLALRTTSGEAWNPVGGEQTLDYEGVWDTRRRVRLEGDRLSVTFYAEPLQPIGETIEFSRLYDE